MWIKTKLTHYYLYFVIYISLFIFRIIYISCQSKHSTVLWYSLIVRWDCQSFFGADMQPMANRVAHRKLRLECWDCFWIFVNVPGFCPWGCTSMGGLRLVGSLKLYVSFAEYPLFSRALLQKRPYQDSAHGDVRVWGGFD